MKCAFPYVLNYPHYDVLQGRIVNKLEVPCGRCINCRIEKSREWSLRCICELPYWKKSIFVTLTYDEEHFTPSLNRRDFQLFMKRLRKRVGSSIKYYACGEYGSNTERKHFHAIIFGVGSDMNDWNYDLNCPYSENHVIEESWSKGHVFCGSVSYHSCRYTADYIFKKYSGEKEIEVYKSKNLMTPFQMFSKGLGKRYFNDYGEQMAKLGYISVNGCKYPIPKYYQELLKNSVFDSSEAHRRVFQHKLDKYLSLCDEVADIDDVWDFEQFVHRSNNVLLQMNEKRQNMFAKGKI